MDSRFDEFERKQENMRLSAKKAEKRENASDPCALDREGSSGAARSLSFSDADDFEEACDDDEFEEQTVVNRVHIKDQPP